MKALPILAALALVSPVAAHETGPTITIHGVAYKLCRAEPVAPCAFIEDATGRVTIVTAPTLGWDGKMNGWEGACLGYKTGALECADGDVGPWVDDEAREKGIELCKQMEAKCGYPLFR